MDLGEFKQKLDASREFDLAIPGTEAALRLRLPLTREVRSIDRTNKDDEALRAALIQRSLVGWSGVTLRVLGMAESDDPVAFDAALAWAWVEGNDHLYERAGDDILERMSKRRADREAVTKN
jgi:hypothetical protein